MSWKKLKPIVYRYLPYILIVLVAVGYYIYNSQYFGPILLTDEVGHVSKAGAFTGRMIDGASKYHSGYGILLIPVFWLIEDPFSLWQGIILSNSLMWAASAGLLWYILRQFFPKKSPMTIFAVSLFGLVYPAYVGGGGLGRATSAVTLVFMLAVVALLKSRVKNPYYLAGFSVMAGFIYWVHPTGITVSMAAIAMLILFSIHYKSIRYIPYILVILFMVGSYALFVDNWVNEALTPDGFKQLESAYASDRYIADIAKPAYWYLWGTVFLGQLAYILVSTFGLAAYASQKIFELPKLGVKKAIKKISTDPIYMTLFFVVISVIAMLLLSSKFMSGIPDEGQIKGTRLWIYGRYTGVLLLPLIGIGLLSKWKLKTAIYMIISVLLSGAALQILAPRYSNLSNIRLGSIQSFWPTAIVESVEFLVWMILGAVGIALVWLIAKNKRWLIILVLPLYIMCINNVNTWHSGGLRYHSQLSGLVDFVRENYPSDTCIGRIGYMERERFKLYTYYFSNYDFGRTSIGNWMNNCNGPLLVFDMQRIDSIRDDVQVVGREDVGGMKVIVKKEDVGKLKYSDSQYGNFYFNPNDEWCVINGCFDWHYARDENKSKVGEITSLGLSTTNDRGNLTNGPFYMLPKGKYVLTIEGDFEILDDWTQLTVNNITRTKRYLEVQPSSKNSQEFTFELGRDTYIGVKLRVGKKSEVNLREYSVERARN